MLKKTLNKLTLNSKNILFLIILLASGGVMLPANAELIDPTKPEGFAAPSQVNTFTLSAIFIFNENKIAVINGRIMHVGDFFSDVQLITIEPNKVVLDGPDGKINLVLLSASVKRSRLKAKESN